MTERIDRIEEQLAYLTKTVEELSEIVADADFNGWTFALDVIGGAAPISVSVTGTATDNTIDEVAALLVTALNADAEIAGASYNGTTNVLTVAETTDAIGDRTLEVTITPPGGYSGIAALVGTIVDGGASGDAITLALPADAAVIPQVMFTRNNFV